MLVRSLVLLVGALVLSTTPVRAHVALTATIDAAQAGVTAPAGAGGTATFSYEDESSTLTYDMTIANLSGPPFAGHIHIGAPGVPGGIVVTLLTPAGTSGNVTGSVGFPPTQVDALFAGGLYVNLHTLAHPGGEVRGQILVQPGSCSCQTAKSPGAFKSCVRKAVNALEKSERKEDAIQELLRFVPKSSCAKKKTPKKAVACCLPNLPEENIVTGSLCAAVPAAKCAKLQGTSAGDGLSCLPTNPCVPPAD